MSSRLPEQESPPSTAARPVERFDPLAHLRTPTSPEFDVFLQGMVFLDIIFTGLPHLPRAGQEIWADGMGSSPGGIANLAVAASRLGLRTSLGAAFSGDDYGEFCWRTLEQQEHVDLSASRRYPDWHSPVTVSVAVDDDRTMVTHGHPEPEHPDIFVGRPPRARAVLLDLDPEVPLLAPQPDDASASGGWVAQAHADGALIFADIGWDPTGRWDREVLRQLEHCHAFLPNAAEAMGYTHTRTAREALWVLADLVPLAVVTQGPDGAIAYDSSTGEEAVVPALRVEAIDATGAGDVFGAALTLGTLAGWPLADRLAFSALCSSLAVQQVGGSLAAPGWGDIADWWARTRACPDQGSYHRSMRRRYAFLDDIVPAVPDSAVRRARATIARLSDA